MVATTTRPRRRRALALVAVPVLALALVGCLNPDAQRAYDLLNAERSGRGLAALALDDALNAKAQAWAETLAAQGQLSHSQLSDGAPVGWSRLGENVGVGASADSVHAALLRSAGHRARMLDAGYTHVGMGAARSADGRIWIAQVFMR
ncbi:MAG TPA: CAP domain-containing protein [Acidimicrobiales bacterium]|nr:CAP domain-containing protein [Acidimicrobiales bacterium]